MRSRTIALGAPVHFGDFGGSGPALVLVHGLGGVHANWLASRQVMEKLGMHYERGVRILDLDAVLCAIDRSTFLRACPP